MADGRYFNKKLS